MNAKTLMTTILLPLAAVADSEVIDGIDWSYHIEAGKAVITGSGNLSDGHLRIPEKIGGLAVAKLGAYAFTNRQDITFIEVPDSLESFGLYGFYDCTNITGIAVSSIEKWLSINIPLFSNPLYQAGDLYVGGRLFTEFVSPKGMASIPSCIFSGCTSLRKVVLREGVRDIEIRAFERCYNLEEVEFPESLETVGLEAFYLCEALGPVSFGSRIRKIEDGAFYDCGSLAYVDFPSVEKYLSTDIYYGWWGPAIYIGGKPLVELVIPDGTVEIRDDAFANCTELKSVVIPDSVQVIGQYAFYRDESLATVTLGSGIREVRYSAFMGCTSLDCVVFPDGVVEFESYVFSGCTSLKEIRIPEGTERIPGWMFENCGALVTLEFPETTRRIDGAAFIGCDALRELVFPESFDYVDWYWGEYTNLTSLVFKGAPPQFEGGYGDYFTPLFLPSMPVTVPEEFADEWSEFFANNGLQNPVVLSPSPKFKVDGVIANQRYPWNGLVDIEFDLDVEKGAADTYSLSFNVVDGADVSVTNFVLKCRAGHVVVSVDLSSCLKGEEDVRVSIGRPRAFCDLACSDWLYYRPATGTILLDEVESELDIAYDCRWGSSDACELRINGETIDDSLGPCGIFAWSVPDEPASYKLELICGDVTLTRYACRPDPEMVEVHWNDNVYGAGTNVWSSDVIHVVCGWGVYVGVGGTLLIEPGAVVKFMPGSGLEVCSDGVCICDGAVLTHVADDTIGGDTLGDGTSALPKKGEYAIDGPLSYGEPPDVRYYMRIIEATGTGTIIDEDTTWEGIGTYRIQGVLSINEGATLTIKPGARLEFEDAHVYGQARGIQGQLSVYGKLSAVGTSARPIVFTSANEIPQPGDWWGIDVDGKAEFTHCRIEYAGPANERALVNNWDGEVVLRKCFLAHALYDGIWCWDESASARLEDCVITDCGNAACSFMGNIGLFNCTIACCNNVSMYWEHWQGLLDVRNCVISEMGLGWVDTNDGHQFNIRNRFSNCLFFNPVGFTLQNCERTGVDGNVWGDPLFVNAEVEDFRIQSGSAARDMANVETATETDHNDVPRGERPDAGAFECYGDARYAADLVPVRLEASPEVAVVGGSATFSWQTANVGAIMSGERRDALYLESASGVSLLVGEVVVAGLQAGAEALTKASFTLPAMSPGRWTPKVVVNAYHDAYEGTNTQNNALRGEAAVEVTIPYATAEDCVGMLPEEGIRLLRLKTDPARQGLVAVKASEGMTVSFGQGFVPTANNASQTFVAAGGIVYFAVPKDGSDVYVLLEDEDGGTFDVSQVEGSAAIGQVQPSQIPPNGTSHLTVTGAGFDANSAVRFVCGNETVVPEEVRVVDSSTIVLTVEGSRMTPGKTYDLVVETASGDIRADGAVSVRALSGKGEFWAKLIVPPVIRQGRLFTCYVEYGNSGTADVLSQIAQVRIEGDGTLGYDGGLEGLKGLQYVAAGAAPTAGVLPPGFSSRIAFTLRAGAENKISLATTWGKDYHAAEWSDAGAYIGDISAAATRLALRGRDATDYHEVLELVADVTMGSASVIAGAVVDKQGVPVEGVRVSFLESVSSNVVSDVTDEIGRFVVTVDSGCLYELYSASLFSNSMTWNIPQNGDVCGVQLVADMSVSCRIAIDGWNSYSNLVLTAENVDSGITYEHYRQDAFGRFEFLGLPDGVYYVRATAMGWSGMTAVSCFADRVRPSYSCIEMHKRCIITGNVQAEVATGSMVVFSMISGCDICSVAPDETGAFSIELEAGIYDIFTTGPASEWYRKSEDVIITENANVILNKIVGLATKSASANSMAVLSASGNYEDHWWELTIDKAQRRLQEAVGLTGGIINAPPSRIHCKHNLDKYNSDLAKRDAFRVDTMAFSNAMHAGNAWKSIADICEITKDTGLMLANLSFGKKCEQAVKYWGEANGGIFVARRSLAKYAAEFGYDIINSAIADVETKANKLNTKISNFEFTAQFIKDIGKSAEELDDAISAIGVLMNTYTVFKGTLTPVADKLAGYASFVLQLIKLAGKVITAAEQAVYSWEGAKNLRDMMPVFEKKIEQYKKDKARFNQYKDPCCGVLVDDMGNPIDVVEPENPVSVDPNEITGPVGKDEKRYVAPGEWMTYTIFFENKSDAANAAQEVWVTNPLSPWLDWSTFEVIDVSFADQVDLGLAGLHRGTSLVDLNGTDYKVQTTVSLDMKTGIADWYLRIVDETTATQWPEDVFAGFLQPNDETHRGEGHLTYRVKVREDAPKGVRIDNSATIVFDYNPPIETDPAWWNTVYAGGEAAFDAEEMKVDEGGTLKVVVNGGNADLASSVQVQVTYNTAAAADLDLKGTTVNGVKPKSFKFPVTLEWAAGEIGEKTVEISVVVDKAVETDEFLTLQLLNPMNMEIGEASACTVMIHDPQFGALKSAVESGTATKAQSNDLQKIEKALVGKSYVRALANDLTRGKVTGSVLAADGKNVSLKATANKGWVFAGWYTDPACTAGHELTGYGDYRNPSFVYANTNGAVTVYARFITPEEDSLSLAEDFLPAEFAVNEEVSISVPVESVSYPTVTVSGLPSGLKYYEKETFVKAKGTTPAYTIPANTIFGTPTKATTNPATVTVTVKNLGGYQIVRKYEVSVMAASPSPAKAKVVSDAPHYSSVAVDLSDDFAGKVTGAGVYQAGKKATLKATANKGYVFSGWYEGDALVSRLASYVLTMPTNDVAFTAKFVTAEEDAASIGATVADFAFGAAAEDGGSTGNATNVMCGVYLEWPVAASALSQPTVAVSGLPAGLKFTAKPVTSKVGTGKTAVTVTNVPPNTIYGAPTAASKTDKKGKVTPSKVKVTVTTAGKSKVVYEIALTVDPLPAWAVGEFCGLASTPEGRLGSASMSVTAAGKVSGKVIVNGTNCTFTASSYDITSKTIGETNLVALVTGKLGKGAVKGGITVVASGASGSLAGAEMTLCRNVWKDKGADPVPADVQGLYTVKLGAGDRGTGYLSLTLDKKGAVKVAGKAPDGTALSATATLMPNGDGAYFADVFCAPSAYKGGYVAGRLGWDADGRVSSDGLDWTSFNPESTTDYYAGGFDRGLSVSGAWYSKTATLLEYYTTLDFKAKNGGVGQVCWENLTVSVDQTGKKFVVDQKKSTPVQDKATKAWSYGGANDAALAISFTQATGIWKGSFLWWFDEPKHTSQKIPFEGIMVQGEDLEGFGSYDVQSSYIPYDKKGNPLKTKTYKFKESVPVLFTSQP